jgi:hypothetical protein
MILCDEDDHRELHKQIEKTFSGVTIGYYKSKQPINEKDVIYEKTFTLKPIVRTEEPKLSMMMNLLNVLYNNGFVKFTVYEKLWPRLLFFDYDVKDEDVILLDYINLKQNKNIEIEKAEVYETKQGYHMHVITKDDISLTERMSIYKNSIQDKARVNVLYSEFIGLKSLLRNEYIISECIEMSDLLFCYKKFEDYISKEKFVYEL